MSMTSSSVAADSGRVCLLVIGMHRSGTSALTRVLSLLGAALPRKILGADHDNQAGHWEPERLIPVHDALLADAGSSWQDWRPFVAQALPPVRLAHHVAELRRLITEEYGDAPLFVLKDPRICRLLPLYLNVLGEMGVAVRPVIAFRNPLEVAASLAARNGMSKADAVLLWLRSVLDAEHDSRGLPRTIVDYGHLLEEGAAAVADWDRRLAVTWPMPLAEAETVIDAVLRGDLRHHAINPDDLHLDAVTAGWMADAFAALSVLVHDEADASARGALDRVAGELARATPLLLAREADALAAAGRLGEEIATTQASADARMAALQAESSAREAAADAQRAALMTEAAAREAALAAGLANAEKRKVALEIQIAEVETEAVTLEAALTTRIARLESAFGAREAAAAAEVAGLQRRIAAEQERFEGLQQQYNTLVDSRRWQAAAALAALYHRLPRPLKRAIEWGLRKRRKFRLRRQSRTIRRSGRFDGQYYLQHNPDVAQMGMDPIHHYVVYGAREGRNPAADFDTRAYLTRYPEAGRSGQNPLVHALRAGTWWSGAPAVVGAPADWPPLQPKQLRDVSVIVPIYNGREHLERLLPALVRNTSRDVEFIFLDDASPDRSVAELVKPALHALPRARYIRSPENRGFVGTVNAAAELARRHFVLLNTDTDVPPGWLERLMAPIFADPGIASATPFSNAATIFSFPRPNEDNRLPGGLSVERIDAAFRNLPQEHWPVVGQLEVPTGVGFCMAINGDVWRGLGGFDVAAFGRGYGEENDWCQRSVARGYRHVLVPNLFVHHDHGGSFPAAEKQQLIADHMAVLTQRWPGYVPSVHAHIARDPWRELRSRALERLCLANRPLLVFDHAMGGGANSYRQQMVRRAESSGVPAVVITHRAGRDAFSATYSFCGVETTRDAARPQDLVDPAAIGDGATLVYNDLVGWPRPLAAVAFMRSLAERSDVHTRALIHDFFSVCPSYTLLDDSTRFCGVPTDLAECRRCLPGNPHAHLQSDPAQWRSAWGGLLEVADEVICFSTSSRTILARAYPALADRVLVRPHEPVTTIERPARLVAGRPLTVGVIGGINVAKGARVVMDLCEHLRTAAPAARVVVIGEVDPAEQRPFPNLTIHGRYAAADLPALVEHHGVNACLLPSIWPETFSYVTQEIMALELPLVCFDVGAPAERVSDYPYGVVIKPGGAADLHQALEQARRRREAVSPAGTGGG